MGPLYHVGTKRHGSQERYILARLFDDLAMTGWEAEVDQQELFICDDPHVCMVESRDAGVNRKTQTDRQNTQ